MLQDYLSQRSKLSQMHQNGLEPPIYSSFMSHFQENKKTGAVQLQS